MKLKNIYNKILINEIKKEDLVLQFLKELIQNSPFEGKAYLAGGFVRDELLGKPSKDIDIVVELPQGGIKFAEFITKKLGIFKQDSNPVVYPKYGTAMFTLRGVKYKGVDLSNIDIECVMTRKEKYNKDSRNPEVSPGSLKDDVERRDFTINSLLKNLSTGEIKDLTGMGREDLKNGVVKTPLDPDVIFNDDPLRMLRAIRFTVKYGFKLPFFMIRSIKKNAEKIKIISNERITTELNKILISPKPDIGLRLLQITGLSVYIMPELEALVNLTQNKYHKDDAFKHTLEVVKNVPPRLLVRLAALFHDIGKAKTKTDSVIVCENCGEKVYVWSEKQSEAVCKHCKHLNKFTSIDELKKKIISYEVRFFEHEEVGAKIAEEIMRRLKYPADVIDAVVAQVKFHMRLKNSGDKAKISDKALRKLKIEIKDHLEDLLDLMHSDNIAHSEESSMPNQIPLIKKRFSTLKLVPAKQHVELPINGNDLLSLGIPRGKRIGELLKFVEDAIMENPDLTRDEALKIVKSHL